MANTHVPGPSVEESDTAPQAVPGSNRKRPAQRRQRGNRANNPRSPPHGSRPIPIAGAPDSTITDTRSAPLSSEDVSIPSGQRHAKKHTRARSTADRAAPATDIPEGSLTDGERGTRHATSQTVATPSKPQAAYAGPTFHASPAPSALPIPKFLSKSVPAKAACIREPLVDSLDAASPPSPSPAYHALHHQADNTTLSLLFKADRDERARQTGNTHISGAFPESPEPFTSKSAALQSRQDSQMSMNALFPIELDGESRTRSLPQIPQTFSGQPSITTPSRLRQEGRPNVTVGTPSFKDPAVQDLLNRLSLSGKEHGNPHTPNVPGYIPSEPSSRHQTPSPYQDAGSPIRSASGPTTPAPSANELQSPFHYGNRNLSPLFKAAKADSPRRNSGLRTEFTPGLPVGPEQSPFQARGGPRPGMGPAPNGNFGPASREAGSRHNGRTVQGPANMGAPNGRLPQTPTHHGYNSRSGSYSHVNNSPSTAGGAAGTKKTSVVNPFIPSSVRAKQFATPPKANRSETASASAPETTATEITAPPTTAPETTTGPQTDSQQLAIDELKRMLKLDGA